MNCNRYPAARKNGTLSSIRANAGFIEGCRSASVTGSRMSKGRSASAPPCEGSEFVKKTLTGAGVGVGGGSVAIVDAGSGIDVNARSNSISRTISSRTVLGRVGVGCSTQHGKPSDPRSFHLSVVHSRREWARGPVHTNTIEGVWAILKRLIMGALHSVSPKHLSLYLNELAWKVTNRTP